MAVAQLYTAVPNDVITAARWNNEFGNIYNNGTTIAFPATTGVSFAGFTITLDAAGATTLSSTASQAVSLTPGVKAGSPTVVGKAINVVASTFTDSATAASGTATELASVSIQQPTFAATNVTVTTTDAATLYIAAAPANGTNNTITNPWAIWVDAGAVRFDGTLRVDGAVTFNSTLNLASSLVVGSSMAAKPIGGLTWGRDAGDTTNDIVVNAGEASSDDATIASRRLMVLASSIIGQIDAVGTWVVGTNQSKRDAGADSNAAWYIFLIQRADTGVVDILFSLSATAPTMPTNYAFKRLIGYFLRAGAANTAFTVTEIEGGGIHFAWTTPIADVALANTLTTSRRTDALSIPLSFSVLVNLRWLIDDAANSSSLICCPDETDAAVSATTAPGMNMRMQAVNPNGGELWIRSSSTGTVASRSATATIDAYDIITLGFKWGRR